ncbi:LexA family transcriptional regulator [Novosphingobium sp. SG707]|uniref:LexA family transcriptional regulator n=1 Tax=Novosphingobium sp. SG707 TaxID=2586996 RepID=UPI001446C883|nr:LexA family transcriptional regulator [Novosphingobium sp. SG707]NKI99614.1 phage repressor protein C with HTH and peptisase S24 domain [Novosphingobium sp. SG707]
MKDISCIRQEDIPFLSPARPLWENPTIMEEVEYLRERLHRRIIERNTTPNAVSVAIGKNRSYVGQVISGKGGMPSAATLNSIAAHLETTTDYLLGRSNYPSQPESEVSFHPVPILNLQNDEIGLPVVATGYCDDLIFDVVGDGSIEIERMQLEVDHVVRLIERPAALRGVKEAYAIYFHGSSMEPRFFQGEFGIVDPRRPPSPGDFVVVQLNDGQSEDVVTVLVKRLVRLSGPWIELEQYKPAAIFRVPRSRVTRLQRIVFPHELLV